MKKLIGVVILVCMVYFGNQFWSFTAIDSYVNGLPSPCETLYINSNEIPGTTRQTEMPHPDPEFMHNSPMIQVFDMVSDVSCTMVWVETPGHTYLGGQGVLSEGKNG